MRIVVFLNESNESNHQLDQLARKHRIAALVLSSRAINSDKSTHILRRLLARGGWSFVLRKAVNILVFRLLSRSLPGRFGLSRSAAAIAREHGFPVLRIKDVNSQEAIQRLSELSADLFVSIYFNQIFRARVLEVPKRGTLNVHGSLLPRFRGLFPYFFTLVEKDERAGVTVHWVDRGIDTGRSVAQAVLRVDRAETVFGLARRQAAIGAQLLLDVMNKLDDAGFESRDQVGPGVYRSWPTRRDVRKLRASGHGFGRLLGAIEPGGDYEVVQAKRPSVRHSASR